MKEKRHILGYWHQVFKTNWEMFQHIELAFWSMTNKKPLITCVE
jgi:hypothetical protein